MRRVKGFTLIEVLVALAIIALGMGAVLASSGHQASQAGYLKLKTMAHYVAMNELTTLQLSKDFPSEGDSTGVTQMAGVDWYWRRTVILTEDEDARQVEFQVFSDKSREKNLTRIIGHVTK